MYVCDTYRGPASIEAIVNIGLLAGVAPGESLSDSPLRLRALLLNDFCTSAVS